MCRKGQFESRRHSEFLSFHSHANKKLNTLRNFFVFPEKRTVMWEGLEERLHLVPKRRAW